MLNAIVNIASGSPPIHDAPRPAVQSTTAPWHTEAALYAAQPSPSAMQYPPPLPFRMRQVGEYSIAERLKRIKLYLTKRHRRTFKKKVKYACRKNLADSRPRVGG